MIKAREEELNRLKENLEKEDDSKDLAQPLKKENSAHINPADKADDSAQKPLKLGTSASKGKLNFMKKNYI